MYEEKIETDSNVNKNSTTRLSTKIDTYEDEITVYKIIQFYRYYHAESRMTVTVN
jgi:hypothetical protein